MGVIEKKEDNRIEERGQAFVDRRQEWSKRESPCEGFSFLLNKGKQAGEGKETASNANKKFAVVFLTVQYMISATKIERDFHRHTQPREKNSISSNSSQHLDKALS